MSSGQCLPNTIGPSLAPFELAVGEKITLMAYISDPAEGKDGAHAHVLKVKIGKRHFALKIFKFKDVSELRSDTLRENEFIDDQTLVYHSDPFYAECRAYGRIKELQQHLEEHTRSRKRALVASPCYGYLILPTEPYELEMETRFGITDWNRSRQDQQRPTLQRMPFRAIVKRLEKDHRSIRSPKKMRDDLELLRAWGIYQRDINATNYIGGYLIDFSVAWTQPHWAFEVVEESRLRDRVQSDLGMFNKMMKDEGYLNFHRAGLSKKRTPTKRKPRPLPPPSDRKLRPQSTAAH